MGLGSGCADLGGVGGPVAPGGHGVSYHPAGLGRTPPLPDSSTGAATMSTWVGSAAPWSMVAVGKATTLEALGVPPLA